MFTLIAPPATPATGSACCCPPRLLRAEWLDPTGEVQGVMLHRANADFFVPVPDDPAITELQVYQPHGNGQAFRPELLGSVQP
jgi:hypothetical protein